MHANKKLFLSTVTNEFLTCRARVSDDFRSPNVVVENQEEYIAKTASGHSMLIKLDDYIKDCDAVIHLIGRQTSTDGRAAAQDAVEDILRRYSDLPVVTGLAEAELGTLSYTQWEAWLAYYHIKTKRPGLKLILATPADGFTPDNPIHTATAHAQKMSQAWHAAELRKRARYSEITFADAKDLSIAIFKALKDILPAQPEQKIAPTRLVSRHTAADFLGREAELALLDAAWTTEHTHVFSLIAWGGVGKTALLARWVQSRFAEKGWKNAQGQPDPLR